MQIHYTFNERAAYDILTYGFMTTDGTMIDEIKKLPYGCYIHITNSSSFTINRYFDFNYYDDICLNKDKHLDEDAIIEKLDMLFRRAVSLAFEKDNEYGYSSRVFSLF